MAKININFNNKDYSVDEQSLSAAINALKSHLSTTMAGTGAKVEFGGVAYNIDGTKLSTATNNFVSHLGTISGNGSKVKVNGVEYSVDSNKVSGAVTELEAVLGGLNNPDTPTEEERLEGDGQEFHKFAPAALTFRSTAPLSELQEVQINGVTVDASNYTTEEGSTVITLPIDYLKTLDANNYEISVVSASKSAKGGFSVVEPQLNNHGFYYNQPYTAYVDMFGENESFFIRDDGTLDVVGTPSGDVSQCTYTCSGNSMTVISPVIGTLTATISDDGTEIFCNELQIAFTLGNESIAADEDYIYIYQEDLGGYEVKAIDKTKAEYGAIKTGINGIDTVKLADDMFYIYDGTSSNLTSAEIPDSVVSIGEGAFKDCRNLVSVTFGENSKLESIGNYAFGYCDRLKNIMIPDSVVDIGAYAFISANMREFQMINGSVSTINSCTFRETNICTVTLGDGITHIGDWAFANCSDLQSIEIPASVVSIDAYAFHHCEFLIDITYNGTISQWNAIEKGVDWDAYTARKVNGGNLQQYTYRNYIVHCSDGDIDANGNLL